VGSRTASNAIAFNGNGFSTAVFTSTLASTALVSPYTFYIGARNNAGINAATSRQYSAAWIGAGLTGAQAAATMGCTNAALTTFGVAVY
jgi:hypothetical protein